MTVFNTIQFTISKTCPCKVYPLKPHFYIEKKNGVCRVLPIFLISAPKHRLWVLVRTTSAPRVPTIYVLSKNKKNIIQFLLKILIFYKFKNLCILHGHVFVMSSCYLRSFDVHFFIFFCFLPK